MSLATRSRVFARVRNILAAVGLFYLVVTFSPLVSMCGAWLGAPWGEPAGHTLVLLGGGLLFDGRLSLDSYWRATAAVRAYHAGRCREIVIAGGGVPPVAEEMRRMLLGNGVPASAIRLETRSSSTRENALFTAPILAASKGPIVLMTSDSHMFRARRTFEKAGVRVLPFPVPYVFKQTYRGWERNPADFLLLTQELMKIAYYEMRGWT